MPCSVVVGYQRFKWPRCRYFQGDFTTQHYTASQPRRTRPACSTTARITNLSSVPTNLKQSLNISKGLSHQALHTAF